MCGYRKKTRVICNQFCFCSSLTPRSRAFQANGMPHTYALENQAIAVNRIQIPLKTIMGIAGIGFFFAAYVRPKWISNRTETSKAKMNDGPPRGNKPAMIRSPPLTPPAINDALLFARA